MAYHSNPDWGFEDKAAGAISGWIAGLVLIALFIVVMIIITLICILLTELIRVFRRTAFADPRSQSWLQWSLIGFLTLLGVAGSLALAAPGLAATAAALAAWSVLAFVVIVEIVDRRECRFDQMATQESEAAEQDRLFDPWSASAQAPANRLGETVMP